MTLFKSIPSKTSFAGIAIIGAALTLSACSQPHPDVKARQDMMKNYGDAMKIMGGMAKEPDTFDLPVFQEQAAFLATDAKNPWAHFENDEATGNAKPEVWANNEDFIAETENFQQVTAELNQTAQASTTLDEIKPAFGAVGESCKSCHTEFQVETDD